MNIWWMLLAFVLGVGAGFLDRHIKKKRMKAHEEICEGVITEVNKTIEILNKLDKEKKDG